MILIENKLEMFENVVYKSRVTEFKKKIAQWETERDRIKKEKEDALEREATDMIARREKLARELGNEQIAKAKEEKRVLELRIMNELEDDLIQAIRQRAWVWTDSEEYKKHLIDGIKVTFNHLKEGTYRLGLTKKDMDKYYGEVEKIAEGMGIKLIPVIKKDWMIGGHILSNEAKTYNLNNDIYTIIEEKRYEIGMLLHDLFKKEAANV
ncbi:hypothetical protein [Peptoniphilus asaccharolyticus]